MNVNSSVDFHSLAISIRLAGDVLSLKRFAGLEVRLVGSHLQFSVSYSVDGVRFQIRNWKL